MQENSILSNILPPHSCSDDLQSQLYSQHYSSTPISQHVPSQQLSKSELLKWVSSELSLQVTNIQRFQSGTLIVLLLARCLSHDLPLLQHLHSKSCLKAKVEMDFIQNYKVVFKVLQEVGVHPCAGKAGAQMDHIDKLIKGKVTETIDFLQLIKRTYDTLRQSSTISSHNQKVLQQIVDEAQVLGIDKDQQKKVFQDATNKVNYQSAQSSKPPSSENHFEKLMQKSSQITSDIEGMLSDNVELKRGNMVERLRTKAAEKERDFYFGKLRDIELLIVEGRREPEELLKAVQKILYAKEDENIEVDEEGNILV